ncbi:MAG: hypothetical protein IPM39_14915 [Chloroflexi bacterium]|nr:hypothetical protein [Chloroflexota bacterium]
MTLTIAFVGILAVAALLFLAGWLLAMAGQHEMQDHELADAYAGGKVAQRAVDIAELRQLRVQLEAGEEGVLAADACLLFDVCQALRLSDGEAQHILGASYLMVIEAPVEVDDERGG